MVRLPSVKKSLLGAVLLAVCASACGLGDSCGYGDLGLVPDDSPEARELATLFAPVVYLVGQESCDPTFDTDPYAPTSVEAFLNEEDVRLIKKKTGRADDSLMRGPIGGERIFELSDGHYLDLFQNAHPRDYDDRCRYDDAYGEYSQITRLEGQLPTVYARVVSHKGETAVQYWFFYYFNDWVNRHEGDFELVQLLFEGDSAADVLAQSDPQPKSAGYSQHTGGWRFEWSDVKREPEGSTHPLVFVASGSHSNYNGPGFWHAKVDFWVAGCDWTRTADRAIRLHERSTSSPRNQVLAGDTAYELVLFSPAEAPSDAFAWSKFKGRWGELSFLSYSGPEGLPETKPWRNPWRWNKKKLSDGEQGKCAMREEPQRSARAGERLLEYLGQEIAIEDIPTIVGDIVIFIITWPGSDIELTLERPDGTIIDGGGPEVVKHKEDDNYEMYRLENAQSGIWKMHLRAKDLDKQDDGTVIAEKVLYEVFDLPPPCDDNEIAILQPHRDADLDGVPNDREGASKLSPCNWDTNGNGTPDMELSTYFGELNRAVEDYIGGADQIWSRGDIELEDGLSVTEIMLLSAVFDEFFKFTDRVFALDAPADADQADDGLVRELEELSATFKEVLIRIDGGEVDLASDLLEPDSYDAVVGRAEDACLELHRVADDVGITLFADRNLACSFDELLFPDD